MFGIVEKPWRLRTQRYAAAIARRTFVVLLLAAVAAPAWAQEQLLLTAVHDARALLLERIRNEQVRIDVATWLLGDRLVTQALIDRHRAGVPVRVIGDRASIFESDPNTRTEFEYLASNGVPIRLRYHPTWFPETMHWKAAIFVGQNVVEFGSANYTTFELRPWSPTDFKDETALFTSDPDIVRAFLTMFDRMWADTDKFLDWPAAYQLETGSMWTAPMTISRARLEPEYPTNVPGMIWSQGDELLSAMIAEINREPRRIDLVSYRLTDPELTDALIRRHQAGVTVRIILEPTQYRNPGFPEYWMVGTMADRLWAAGVPIRIRRHEGLTHMKSLVTSSVALIASANFTEFWQRDHNYFASVGAKPAIYQAMADRFEQMWNDAVNFGPFQPLPPSPPSLQSPGSSASGVSTAGPLVWRRAPFATAFDVYVGRAAASLEFAGRVDAVVSAEPPATYSLSLALQPSTTYFWRVVARTDATPKNPSLVAASEIRAFTTGTSAGTSPPQGCPGDAPGPGWTCVNGGWLPPTQPPPPPTQPPPPTEPPPPQSPVSCTTVQPGPGWVCVNGGWLPPGHPAASGSPPPPTPTEPAPNPTSCTTVQPGPDWVCVNGGWLPPGHPAASGSPPQASPPPPGTPPSSTVPCTTVQPGPSWTCVNGGWLPPGFPLSPLLPTPPPPAATQPGTCTTPDPFVALGGGVCVNGGWVPKGHPTAGGL